MLNREMAILYVAVTKHLSIAPDLRTQPIMSVVRNQSKRTAAQFTHLYMQFQTPAHRVVSPTFGWIFPPQFISSRNSLTDMLRFVSIVVLDTVMLTFNITTTHSSILLLSCWNTHKRSLYNSFNYTVTNIPTCLSYVPDSHFELYIFPIVPHYNYITI